MRIDDLEEFISYVRSTGATCETSLFSKEELLKIENKAFSSSDDKIEKIIRKIWSKKWKKMQEKNL